MGVAHCWLAHALHTKLLKLRHMWVVSDCQQGALVRSANFLLRLFELDLVCAIDAVSVSSKRCQRFHCSD